MTLVRHTCTDRAASRSSAEMQWACLLKHVIMLARQMAVFAGLLAPAGAHQRGRQGA